MDRRVFLQAASGLALGAFGTFGWAKASAVTTVAGNPFRNGCVEFQASLDNWKDVPHYHATTTPIVRTSDKAITARFKPIVRTKITIEGMTCNQAWDLVKRGKVRVSDFYGSNDKMLPITGMSHGEIDGKLITTIHLVESVRLPEVQGTPG